MSIAVFCPTRNRPKAIREAAYSLIETRRLGSTRLVAIIDADDLDAEEYVKQANTLYDYVFPIHEGGMVAALNAGVKQVLAEDPSITICGFIGDDHRFRTKGWDEAFEKELARPGYVYGYDGFWHDGKIPTQIFISREIVEALGYMALPDCHHLYVDNAWRSVGDAIHRFTWRRDVLIEHMHPAINKAEWDEGYKRVNSDEMYERDRKAFEAWRASPRFAEDVQRARRALGSPTIATR